MSPETPSRERRSKPRPRPSVLALVVAHEPGDFFDESIASLAAQTYDRLGALVVLTGDQATHSQSQATVKRHLPKAKVVVAPEAKGYAAAVEAGLADFGERAAFILFCHDDVALATNAVEALVSEAMQSNAGVVGPKIVDWVEPRMIQSVGFATDKFATPIPLAERGDLDQEQYDAVEDVFSVAGACLLIRNDLYELIGGHDSAMSFYGDDLDLCWRVQAAGARVVVAPNAVARHRAGLEVREVTNAGDPQRLRLRHSIRTMLSGYGGFRTARVLPQAVLLTLVQAVAALVTGKVGRLRGLIGAWTWNLSRITQLRRRRKQLAEFRQLSDGDFRDLQRGGSYWLSQAVSSRIGADQRDSAAAFGRSFRSSSVRVPAAIAFVLGAVWLFGSRTLLTSPIPAIGQLAHFDSSPGDLFGEWWSGWWTTGLGTDDSAPFGYPLLALVGTVFLGAMGTLRRVVLLGLIPLGVLGAWSILRSSGSRRGQLVTALVYLAIPVGFNALSVGSWYGLIAYAVTPWLLGQLGRAHGTAPFRAPGDVIDGSQQPVGQVLRLGLLLGVAGAFVPPIWIVYGLLVVGLWLGALVAGSLNGTWRMLSVAVPAGGVGLALNLPWFLGIALPKIQWAPLAAAGSDDVGSTSFADLFLFNTGGIGLTRLLAGLAVSGMFVLIVGRAWRLVWGARAWALAMTTWAVIGVSQFGLLPLPAPDLHVMLPVAAIGIALACGLGAVAFEADLQLHDFGWRQLLTVVAVAAIAVSLVPFLSAATNGRWAMARSDIAANTAFLPDADEVGGYRVLWIGSPEVLPAPGVPLDDDMAFFTTDSQGIDISDQWVGRLDAPTRQIQAFVADAVNGDTSRLGEKLAPLGIRFVVFVERIAPAPFVDEVYEAPETLVSSFGGQLDIRRISTVNRAMRVYANDAWFSTRSAGLVVDPVRPRPDAAALIDRTGAASFAGRIDTDSVVYVAAPTNGWKLTVGGERVPRQEAFGWASSFSPATGGDAELRFEPSAFARLIRVAQLLGWGLVIAGVLGVRSRADRRRQANVTSTTQARNALTDAPVEVGS